MGVEYFRSAIARLLGGKASRFTVIGIFLLLGLGIGDAIMASQPRQSFTRFVFWYDLLNGTTQPTRKSWNESNCENIFISARSILSEISILDRAPEKDAEDGHAKKSVSFIVSPRGQPIGVRCNADLDINYVQIAPKVTMRQRLRRSTNPELERCHELVAIWSLRYAAIHNNRLVSLGYMANLSCVGDAVFRTKDEYEMTEPY